MKKLMLCSIFSILFFNIYSQDTTCTMVRLYEVVEFNYKTNKVINRYSHNKRVYIDVEKNTVLCLHLYDKPTKNDTNYAVSYKRYIEIKYPNGITIKRILNSRNKTIYIREKEYCFTVEISERI